MRCPKCKKLILPGASRQGESVRCSHCGFVDLESDASERPRAADAQIASPNRTPPEIQRPRLLNARYALAAKPRVGGMARVYRASDLHNDNKIVAVKILSDDRIEAPILQEVFKRETDALRELTHDGIVKLLDSGLDEDTGQYFLVFEWMEEDLQMLLNSSPSSGWDEFCVDIAVPVLEALAFAHSRNVVHRDLKLGNILIDNNRRPRLADFGISKLKHCIRPGITLAEFVSRPYTPREYDDGTFTYTRDVFAFAVVILASLTDVALVDYESIDTAFDALKAPHEIKALLKKALSQNPEDRPENAAIFLSEIQSIQRRRQVKSSRQRKCYIELSPKATEVLRTEIEVDSLDSLNNIILEDLNTECGIAPHKQTNPQGVSEIVSGQYWLYGISYRYHVTIKAPHLDRLFVFRAWRAQHSILEQSRDREWIAPYDFSIAPPTNVLDAKDVIRELTLAVDEHQAERRHREALELEKRLYVTWRAILKAKADFEQSRQPVLRYNGVRLDRDRIHFTLLSIPDDDLFEQPRSVRLPNKKVLDGIIEDIRDGNLVLRVANGDPALVPRSGELVFDTRLADVAIDRQRAALDAVQYERAVRPDLGKLLVRPETAQEPYFNESIEFSQDGLDEDKQVAVRAALGTKDFLVVEGPPGTGKTTFIAEVVQQTLLRAPQARILLTSQTHVALDNALEKIVELKSDLKLLRIGRVGGVQVSPKTADLSLDRQMDAWRTDVLERGQHFLSTFAEMHAVSPDLVEIADLIEQINLNRIRAAAINERIDCRERELQDLSTTNSVPSQEQDMQSWKSPSREDKSQVQLLNGELRGFSVELKALKATITDEQKRLVQLVGPLVGGLELEEVDRMNSDELASLAKDFVSPSDVYYATYRKLRKIHQEWHLRFARTDDFNAALLKRASVIAGTCIGVVGVKGMQDISFDLCIVDEASKATETEVLVPMSRAKRWILVGDQKQLPPFKEEVSHNREILENNDLELTDLGQSLFGHLLRSLPESCRTSLFTQHRMVTPIGDLISGCFYDGKLKSSGRQSLDWLRPILAKPVAWFSTASIADRVETSSGNGSYKNHREAIVIRDLIGGINDSVPNTLIVKLKIAVLTGYLEQKQELTRVIRPQEQNWQGLEIDCYTVDSYQGREADVAIYSVTRQNAANKLGHLSEYERLNVALSRAKYGLIIVGDHKFCATARGPNGQNPFRVVLDHIERNGEQCVLKEVQL